jgi:aminoglycoside phosphotransferase (APT) family kinase protein
MASVHHVGESAAAVARDLLGAAVDAIEPVTRGRNSRVYRIAAGADRYALKQYPTSREDARDRLGTEIDALRLMQQLGVPGVPRVIAADTTRRFALLTWIEGMPVDAIADADIDAAGDFLAALHAMRRAPPGRAFSRQASEACLSGLEAETQIRRRLDALRMRCDEEPALARFLEVAFVSALDLLAARARCNMATAGLDFAGHLPQDRQSLVPSDFGFHNILRRVDGSLSFLDFEYFGWDDPVKLTADILHHPGSPLSPRHQARFRAAATAIYGDGDRSFAVRLDALYPLFGLRWVLILLNEFLPERWRQRVAAGETESWSDAKARQLSRARELFARLVPIEENAAHG